MNAVTMPPQVFIEAACFFVDARRFYCKWLADVRDGQAAGGSGQFPQFAPTVMAGFDGGPAWSDAGQHRIYLSSATEDRPSHTARHILDRKAPRDPTRLGVCADWDALTRQCPANTRV